MSVMSSANPKFVEILQGPYTGVLTTLFADGSPQSTPLWFLLDGDDILFSTTAGKQKLRNIARDPRATFAVYNPTNDMSYAKCVAPSSSPTTQPQTPAIASYKSTATPMVQHLMRPVLSD